MDEKLREFSVPTFDADAEHNFKKSHDNQVVELVSNLKDYKKLAAEALERSVFVHYPEFIMVSKEISQMESDMLTLKNMLKFVEADLSHMAEVSLDFNEAAYGSFTEEPSLQAASDLQWILDAPMDLDVFLAERNFSEAVLLIEKLSKHFSGRTLDTVLTDAKTEIDKRQQQLVVILTEDLQNPTRRGGEVKKLIGFLLRVGKPQQAADVYLTGRHRYIQMQARKVQFQGDISIYIRELSKIIFAIIKSTCMEYAGLFADKALLALLTIWTTKEVDTFIERFQRQVFGSGGSSGGISDNFQVIAECMSSARINCQILEECGMSFNFYLDTKFKPSIMQAVEGYYSRVQEDAVRRLQEETWVVYELPVSDTRGTTTSIVRVTDSARFLYQITQQLIDNLAAVANPAMYTAVVGGMERLFSVYFDALASAASSQRHRLTDKQNFGIIADASFLTDDLLTRISRLFQRVFRRPITELETVQKKLTSVQQTIRDEFCVQKSRFLLNEVVRWHHINYSTEEVEERSRPSSSFGKLFHAIADVKAVVSSIIGSQQEKPIAQKLMQQVVTAMREDAEIISKVTGKGGLQQFALDLRFLALAGGDYLSDKGHDMIGDMVDKAMKSYCAHSKASTRGVMMSDEWFALRVQQGLDALLGNDNTSVSADHLSIGSNFSTPMQSPEHPFATPTTATLPKIVPSAATLTKEPEKESGGLFSFFRRKD